jgi:hypothetical protein
VDEAEPASTDSEEDVADETVAQEIAPASQAAANVVAPMRQVRDESREQTASQRGKQESDRNLLSSDEESLPEDEEATLFAPSIREHASSDEQLDSAAARSDPQPQMQETKSDGGNHIFWDETTLDTELLWKEFETDSKLEGIDLDSETFAVGSATVTVTALSAGYLLWTLRGGSLLASFLSSLPAWRMMDPLPILENFQDRPRGAVAGDDEDDEESLQSMLAGRH